MGGIDIILLLIVAGITWLVAGEGAWGAALALLGVIFSGVLAMNCYEILAVFLSGNGLGTRADFVSLVGLFIIFVFIFRLATDKIMPTYVFMHGWVNDICRWGLAATAGYVTMAILLTSLHTATLPRTFWGFTPERRNFFDISAPDRQWLGFNQYVSEKVFRQGGVAKIFDGPVFKVGDPRPEYQLPNEVWPSFPIRYATRRDQIDSMSTPAAGGSSGGGGIEIQQSPDSTSDSTGGGGGGPAAF